MTHREHASSTAQVEAYMHKLDQHMPSMVEWLKHHDSTFTRALEHEIALLDNQPDVIPLTSPLPLDTTTNHSHIRAAFNNHFKDGKATSLFASRILKVHVSGIKTIEDLNMFSYSVLENMQEELELNTDLLAALTPEAAKMIIERFSPFIKSAERLAAKPLLKQLQTNGCEELQDIDIDSLSSDDIHEHFVRVYLQNPNYASDQYGAIVGRIIHKTMREQTQAQSTEEDSTETQHYYTEPGVTIIEYGEPIPSEIPGIKELSTTHFDIALGSEQGKNDIRTCTSRCRALPGGQLVAFVSDGPHIPTIESEIDTIFDGIYRTCAQITSTNSDPEVIIRHIKNHLTHLHKFGDSHIRKSNMVEGISGTIAVSLADGNVALLNFGGKTTDGHLITQEDRNTVSRKQKWQEQVKRYTKPGQPEQQTERKPSTLFGANTLGLPIESTITQLGHSDELILTAGMPISRIELSYLAKKNTSLPYQVQEIIKKRERKKSGSTVVLLYHNPPQQPTIVIED